MKSKDYIYIPQCRDAMTSTWANILKDNRSSFMTDPNGSTNHDALCLSPSHMHLRNVHLLLLIEKNSPCSEGSGFPLSLSEWSFTICPMPYNRK